MASVSDPGADDIYAADRDGNLSSTLVARVRLGGRSLPSCAAAAGMQTCFSSFERKTFSFRRSAAGFLHPTGLAQMGAAGAGRRRARACGENLIKQVHFHPITFQEQEWDYLTGWAPSLRRKTLRISHLFSIPIT